MSSEKIVGDAGIDVGAFAGHAGDGFGERETGRRHFLQDEAGLFGHRLQLDHCRFQPGITQRRAGAGDHLSLDAIDVQLQMVGEWNIECIEEVVDPVAQRS